MIWSAKVLKHSSRPLDYGVAVVGPFDTKAEAVRMAMKLEAMFTRRGWTLESGRLEHVDAIFHSFQISVEMSSDKDSVPPGLDDETLAFVNKWAKREIF
jgi:hypothetical protein